MLVVGSRLLTNRALFIEIFKPDNLIVGKTGQVKVLDFGLARAAGLGAMPIPQTESRESVESGDQLLNRPLTQVGTRLGTTAYMAPEHFRMQELDSKTDQFSFCVTMFEALYGKRPFPGMTQAAFEENVTQGNVQIPESAEVPPWIKNIILRGLSVSKSARYSNIESLLEALGKDPEEERRQKRNLLKRRLLLVGVILLAVLVPLWVWYDLRYGAVFQCIQKTEAETKRVWADKTRSKIKQAFLQTQASFAPTTWNRVELTLDRYVQDWAHQRAELCESVWVGMQSEQLIDRKLRCLGGRLDEFQKLTSVFARADASVVQKAVQAAANLSSINHCLDEEALRSDLELPHERVRPQVESLRERLVTVKVLTDAGKVRETEVLARTLLAEAEKLSYRPLLAESLYWLGELEERFGNYRAAQKMLARAYWQAVESDHVNVMALTSMRMIYVVGYRLGHAQEGEYWGWIAKTAIARLKWPPKLAGLWNDNMGIVYGMQGNEEKELEYHRRALQIKRNHLGKDHYEVANYLNNLGVIFWRRGELEQALVYYQKAVENGQRAYGVDHPQVANYLNNIGLVLWKQGEFESASDYLVRAQVIWETSLGDEHPLLAWPLAGLGEVYQALGKQSEALAKFVRVTRICKKVFCHAEPEGMAYFGLAKGVWARDRNRSRALAYAQKAREIYAKAASFQREREAIDAWIANVR